MLNKIVLMGRLTRDPELRHTQSGTPVASFSLAVERKFCCILHACLRPRFRGAGRGEGNGLRGYRRMARHG